MLNILQTGEIKAKQANKLDVGKVNFCIIIIIIPILSPLRITLPYHAPSPPLFHSTHVTTLHFTFPPPLPYPTNPPLPNSILPSPPLYRSLPYHALCLTLPNCPLPYHTLPHTTPLFPPLPPPMFSRLPYRVLPYAIPFHYIRPSPPSYRTISCPYSTPLYPPLPFYPNIHILP